MYKLYIPIIHETDENIDTVRKLCKEILGYNNDEIQQFIDLHFDCSVVKNLSIEQAKMISEIFIDNDIQIYLQDQKDDKFLFWKPDLGIELSENTPGYHCYDNPVISREHLVNPLVQKEVEMKDLIVKQKSERVIKSNCPTITCPYCQSTNLSKITNTKKAVKIGLFGIFGAIDDAGKTWKCNKCSSKF